MSTKDWVLENLRLHPDFEIHRYWENLNILVVGGIFFYKWSIPKVFVIQWSFSSQSIWKIQVGYRIRSLCCFLFVCFFKAFCKEFKDLKYRTLRLQEAILTSGVGCLRLELGDPQFSSVAQSCPTLCDPMNRSTPGLPVHHQIPEFTQTHVHRVGEAIQPSYPLVLPFCSCPQSFPASGSFPLSQLFTSGGQSIGVSASASVLPMNTQAWSPLGWTGWISLQSKELSRVFSNTTVQKHQFFGAQLSL